MLSVLADVIMWPVYLTFGGVVLGAVAVIALIVWAVKRLKSRK